MTKANRRVWIALYNMGGPDTQEDVEPFLRSLFTDPDLLDIPLGGLLQDFVADKIIRKRLGEVKKRYMLMGGGSPQLSITRSVATALNATLNSHNDKVINIHSPQAPVSYTLAGISPMMRYSQPRAQDVLDECAKHAVDELWLLSQYPHCARATTGSSLRELAFVRSNGKSEHALTIRSFASYGDEPSFIELWTERIRAHWSKLPAGNKHLLVSAHNLPLSYIAQGDPYPLQIRRTAQEVTRRLGLQEGRDWTLCWQSAVGPVRWMAPTTEESIETLSQNGVEHLLMWPVSFVSDHIETLVEIDVEYAEYATHKGLKSVARVANLNADFDFVSFLTSLVHRGASDLATHGKTLLLRDFTQDAAGPFCSSQPAGCLCANYYLSGQHGQKRGTRYSALKR